MNKDGSFVKRPKWLCIKEAEVLIHEMDVQWVHPELKDRNMKCTRKVDIRIGLNVKSAIKRKLEAKNKLSITDVLTLIEFGETWGMKM